MRADLKSKKSQSRSRYRKVLILMVSLCALASLSGCRSQERRNLGVEDGINSFLYNFDTRDEVAALVREMKKGITPSKLTWHYSRSSSGTGRSAPLSSSSDRAFITDVYFALGDAIVVGIANNQSPATPVDLTFVLSDGTDCTFHFVQENTVRISGQNYVLEDGGKLWRLLAGASGSVETETEEMTETLTEADEMTEALTEADEITEDLTETEEMTEDLTETEEMTEEKRKK